MRDSSIVNSRIWTDSGSDHSDSTALMSFLPRCMECRRVLTVKFLSVRPSVRPSVCQTRAL